MNVRDLGRVQEVRFEGDPQDLLKSLSGRARIQHFEIAKPSLHDIFIRIAGPGAEEESE